MPIYYANPTPIFQPAMRLISAITQANPAVVTTAQSLYPMIVPVDHDYITGTVVRLNIPPACGMQQANQLTGAISVISPTTFSIDIDTTQFAPFVIPTFTPHVNSAAQVTPIGEVNAILTAATQNVLPF